MRQDDSDDDRQRRSIGNRDLTEWRTPVGRSLARAHRRIGERTSHRAATLLTVGVGAAFAVGATWTVTGIYDQIADNGPLTRLDRRLLHDAMRMRGPVLDGASAAIARIAGPVGMPIIAVAAGTALSLRARERSPIITVVVAGAGSLLMTIGGKDVVKRHRPPKRDAIAPYETSPSFPSGHTLNATAVIGTAAYLLALRQRSNATQIATATGATAIAATVGASRILLGAHWFSDVLTGWTLGAGWLATIITTHRLHLTNGPDRAA